VGGGDGGGSVGGDFVAELSDFERVIAQHV